MSDRQDTRPIDAIRWSFAADPARSAEIKAHLEDLGLDVYVNGEAWFTAIWEEPDGDLDEVIERLWEINGAPFEVTHEAFLRVEHLVYEAGDEEGEDVARAVA